MHTMSTHSVHGAVLICCFLRKLSTEALKSRLCSLCELFSISLVSHLHVLTPTLTLTLSGPVIKYVHRQFTGITLHAFVTQRNQYETFM